MDEFDLLTVCLLYLPQDCYEDKSLLKERCTENELNELKLLLLIAFR